MKQIIYLFIVIVAFSQPTVIPIGGNGFSLDSGVIQDDGYNFTKFPASFEVYIYIGAPSKVALSLNIINDQPVVIEATVGSENLVSSLINSSQTLNLQTVGIFQTEVGYNRIQITIASQSSFSGTGLVGSIQLDGGIGILTYAADALNFQNARRGSTPSLYFDPLGLTNATYFYSEIYIPEQEDCDYEDSGPKATYYLTNGFDQGQLGLQIDSFGKRTIVFTVYSGYTDPSTNPADYTVTEINTCSFGGSRIKPVSTGPGSQLQINVPYQWTTGRTYGLLLQAEPLFQDATIFTAWFYDRRASHNNRWILIASFKRPQIQTYLTGPYAFLSCTDPDFGNLHRKVYLKNQWFYDDLAQQWDESTDAFFQLDLVGNKNMRRDVNGGVKNKAYFLQTGGFFNDTLADSTPFTRGNGPEVDFATLPR